MTLHRRRPTPSGGFTLAEAAVTIAIVAVVLMAVLQGMEGAKLSAFHTKQRKTAYELGTAMLGEIVTGQYREELESGMTGSFAEKDEPDFLWEVALGEDVFEDIDDDPDSRPFDNYAARRDWAADQDDDDEDDEEAEEPFEKVRLRVTFTPLDDFPNEVVLETWVPWVELYGEDEEEDELSGDSNVGGPLGNNGDGDAPANGEG